MAAMTVCKESLLTADPTTDGETGREQGNGRRGNGRRGNGTRLGTRGEGEEIIENNSNHLPVSSLSGAAADSMIKHFAEEVA